MSDSHTHLTRVAAARWRLALLLTATMTVVYVGFILLIAFNKPLLGTILMPGLSLGILIGVWDETDIEDKFWGRYRGESGAPPDSK